MEEEASFGRKKEENTFHPNCGGTAAKPF